MPVAHVGSGAWLGGSGSASLPLCSHPKSGTAATSLPRPHTSCRAAAAHSRDHSTLDWDMVTETKPSSDTNQTELPVNPYSCLKNKTLTLRFQGKPTASLMICICVSYSHRGISLVHSSGCMNKSWDEIQEHHSWMCFTDHDKLHSRSGYFSQKREHPMFGIPVNRKKAKFGTFTCEQFGGRVFLALWTEC